VTTSVPAAEGSTVSASGVSPDSPASADASAAGFFFFFRAIPWRSPAAMRVRPKGGRKRVFVEKKSE
jgi:hypothetical protein